MKLLRRLGVVVHVSMNSRNLIVKAETTPRVGDPVFDSKLRRVGVVFDILGPVSNPYVSAKPEVDNPERYVGKPLYLTS